MAKLAFDVWKIFSTKCQSALDCPVVIRSGNLSFAFMLAAAGVKFEISYREVAPIGLKLALITDPVGTRIELAEGLAAR